MTTTRIRRNYPALIAVVIWLLAVVLVGVALVTAMAGRSHADPYCGQGRRAVHGGAMITELQLQLAEKARRRRRYETRTGAVHRTRFRPGGRRDKHPRNGKDEDAWRREEGLR